ncbi:MAG: hypothetical protein R2751_09755 [Bacteroidales bacterium]
MKAFQDPEEALVFAWSSPPICTSGHPDAVKIDGLLFVDLLRERQVRWLRPFLSTTAPRTTYWMPCGKVQIICQPVSLKYLKEAVQRFIAHGDGMAAFPPPCRTEPSARGSWVRFNFRNDLNPVEKQALLEADCTAPVRLAGDANSRFPEHGRSRIIARRRR